MAATLRKCLILKDLVRKPLLLIILMLQVFLVCRPEESSIREESIFYIEAGLRLEPFDDSMPEILKQNGIYTHLVSDHQHYWEDGGATYHTRYQSWEISRGQEGDPWKGSLEPITPRASFGPEPSKLAVPFAANWKRQDAVNRTYMREKEDFPQAKTFRKGNRIHRNQSEL